MAIHGNALLELDGLEVRLGGRPVLRGLTGSLAGRIVGLLGPNGAGKTTLLATLLGFHQPSAGTARLLGRDIRLERRKIREQLGYMPESDAYVAHLSAVRYVRMMAELSGLDSKAALERAHEALFYVGLGEARYRRLDTYSLGMKQLAKLAQSIAHGPEVLLLDEPTNGLDPAARTRMLKLVREIGASGVRIILSSHLLRDVDSVCDEVIVLREGQVATIANLAAERESQRRFLEVETRGTDPAKFIAQLSAKGCEVAELQNRRLKIVLPESVAQRELWRLAEESGLQLRRLTVAKNSLEHLFLKAMEENGARADTTKQPEAPRAGL
ncbi:MAG: ABC transporter ATP-binding protein [Myxococcota bacterium]